MGKEADTTATVEKNNTSTTSTVVNEPAPINKIARMRRIRRMIFAVVLVVVAVLVWAAVAPKVSKLEVPADQTTTGQVRAPVRAETAQEALQQMRSATPQASGVMILDAGVIAATNHYTALGTYDGFVFPGATTITGSTGVVLIVQESGTCFVRIVTTGAAPTEVVNDPHACTTAGQLELKNSLS